MNPAQQSQAPFHSASLYVGDLNLDVTEALLFEIFNTVGPVASIRVCRDAVTRRSLGYAYVNFHNVSDAERALDTMNYAMIKSKPCRIMWSQRDPSLRKSGVGNVFVKNLDPSIDNKQLYDTFSLFGNILSCKVAQDANGESKGYGYVHYETAEAANYAISKTNGNQIDGREVYVGHFQRRNERSGATEWTNCYVKNIPASWTSERLKEEFSPYGEVSSAVVVKGPPRAKPAATPEGEDAKAEGGEKEKENETPKEKEETPKDDKETPKEMVSRGFGFVNFVEPDAAKAAVEALNGKAVEGEEDAEGTPKELYVGRAQKKSERDRELRTRLQAMKAERIHKYQGVNLYVKNLEDTVTDDKLRAEFAAHGTITSARVMVDGQTRSRGFGFICFATPEEASEAVAKMNGKIIDGKPVYVALAQRKEVRRAQLEAAHAQQRGNGQVGMGRGMAGGGPMGQPPMYGAAPMFYAGHPQQMPPQVRQMMYPQQQQQMMGGPGPRGPRGPMPNYRGGPGYQMPPYAGMPMPGQPQGPGPQGMGQQQQQGRGPRGQHPQQQQRGQRGGPQGGRGMQGGRMQGQQQQGQGQGQQGNRNFKYTSNARNQPPQGAPMQPTPAAAPAAAAAPPAGPEPLTPAALAAATPEMQKNMIGERLYPLVMAREPEMAGKITGMLLEMDNGELLHLLESPDDMQAKVAEAMQVLRSHQEGEE